MVPSHSNFPKSRLSLVGWSDLYSMGPRKHLQWAMNSGRRTVGSHRGLQIHVDTEQWTVDGGHGWEWLRSFSGTRTSETWRRLVRHLQGANLLLTELPYLLYVHINNYLCYL